MNKAWVLPLALALGCGQAEKPPDDGNNTTLTCSPESDALKFVASGDALSGVLGTWKVCQAGDSGTRLDGIELTPTGWQGLRIDGGALVNDYTLGGPAPIIDKTTFPSTLIFVTLPRWGGGAFSTSVKVFAGPRMDMEFTMGDYAGGTMIKDKATAPSSADCRPSMKPFEPTDATALGGRLEGQWQLCDGVGPFPRAFDGVEFADGKFYDLTSSGGTLIRDTSFNETFSVVDSGTTPLGPGGFAVAISGTSSAAARALVYPEAQARLYLANGDYWGVYKKVQ